MNDEKNIKEIISEVDGDNVRKIRTHTNIFKQIIITKQITSNLAGWSDQLRRICGHDEERSTGW